MELREIWNLRYNRLNHKYCWSQKRKAHLPQQASGPQILGNTIEKNQNLTFPLDNSFRNTPSPNSS